MPIVEPPHQRGVSDMARRDWKGARGGWSVTELLVCMVVVGILVGIFVPAAQYARQAALATVCKNNLRQICLAVERTGNGAGEIPRWSPQPGTTDGWVAATLPYLETLHADQVFPGQQWSEVPEAGKRRPGVLTCPLNANRQVAGGFDRQHYTFIPSWWSDQDGETGWAVMDTGLHLDTPWFSGRTFFEEHWGHSDSGPLAGPHQGLFHRAWQNGGIDTWNGHWPE